MRKSSNRCVKNVERSRKHFVELSISASTSSHSGLYLGFLLKLMQFKGISQPEAMNQELLLSVIIKFDSNLLSVYVLPCLKDGFYWAYTIVPSRFSNLL